MAHVSPPRQIEKPATRRGPIRLLPGTSRARHAGTISWRAILLGLLVIPGNIWWIGQIEGVWHGLHFTCLSLPMPALVELLLLVGVNALLRRWRPRWAFTQAELLTFFAMTAVSGILAGHDRLVTLMGIVAHPIRFATESNRWEEIMWPYLPSWLMIWDEEAAYHYYSGGSSYWLYWRHWVKPAIGWTSLSLLISFEFLCLNVIMRKRWTEEERLSYPMVQIPLAMTAPGSGFWRSRPLWFGIGIAVAIDVVNGLHHLYPSLPEIIYQGEALDLRHSFPDKPWNAIGATRADWYPLMIGLGFLLPMDIIFSTWFFYLMGKAQLVWGAATGIRESIRGYPHFTMQALGAVIVIGAAALWQARGYLARVGQRAFFARGPLSDKDEALSYRAALIGAAVGFVLLCAFGMAVGLPLKYVGVYFGVFLLLAVAIARLRAESGAPAHGLALVNPHVMLLAMHGSAGQQPETLTGFALFNWFNRFNRAHPMPQQLEGLKIAQQLRLSQRRMWIAMALSTAVTLLLAFVIFPPLMYRSGASLAAELTWTGTASFGGGGLSGWLNNPKPPDKPAMGFLFGGGAFALLLTVLRARFTWFPFHPMGYALGVGSTVDRWWFALIICTVLKGAILRYAGVRGLRMATPFFMGLVIGQYVVACLWSLVALAMDQPMYWSWRG